MIKFRQIEDAAETKRKAKAPKKAASPKKQKKATPREIKAGKISDLSVSRIMAKKGSVLGEPVGTLKKRKQIKGGANRMLTSDNYETK